MWREGRLRAFYFGNSPKMFNEIRLFQDLAATGFSVAGGGLGMGVSAYADCGDKYKRSEGGKDVCADGNATDNWDTPPAGGWGYYNIGFEGPVACPADAFCPASGNF